PATPSHGPALKAAEAGGPKLGLRIQPVPVRSVTEVGLPYEPDEGDGAPVGVAPGRGADRHRIPASCCPTLRHHLLAMTQARTPPCPHCDQPMKLVHTIPPLEAAWPALLAFYCAPCFHAETKEVVRASNSVRLILRCL